MAREGRRWRHASPRRLFTRAGHELTLLPTIALVGAFFLAPVLIVVVYSFGTQAYLSTHITYATLDHYKLLPRFPYGITILRSTGLAALTAFGCLIVAYPAAYLIARKSGSWRNILLILLIVPFWTSFLIRTYAWTNILQSSGPLNNLLDHTGLTHRPLELLYTWKGVAIGMIYSYLPLMILPLYASLERLDGRLLEAAADLGASRFRTLWRVVIPQSSGGILAGLVIVGAPATAEYLIPQILGGGKTLLLGNLIATQFGTSFDWPLGAALAVVSMLELSLFIVLLSWILGRRGVPELA